MSSEGTLTPAPSLHEQEDYDVRHGDDDIPTNAEKTRQRELKGWKRIVHGSTFNWFSIIMGTGIVSILFFEIPFQASWLYWLSMLTFLLNVLLFTIFVVLTILRYSMYPGLFVPMLKDLSQSLFIGTISMGLSTILTMLVQLGNPVLGQRVVTVAWALWWIDVAFSVLCCFSMPYLVMYANKKELKYMTATWLFPVITTIVASGTGVIIAGALEDPQQALLTLTACYILWGSGMALALSLLVIYLLRLFLYRFPPHDNMVSVFLPLGPLGQGAFAIQKFGAVAIDLFPRTNTLNHATTGAGNILYVFGWALALPLWGFAMVWLVMAVVHIFSSRFPFNMGWWAFTFPLGTVALATITIGHEMPSLFFDVLGTIFSAVVILLWMMCFVKTTYQAWTGHLFPKR